jgi:4-hydroxy-tetrahydrodipicolinate reductase
LQYRVVQWASGNVGKAAVRAVAANPDMKIVGMFVHSPDKVGRDIGEICELGRSLGASATSSVDEILALEADCVLHMPLPSLIHGDRPQADDETIVALLESGKNVISTVGYMYPKAHGPETERKLNDAAVRGGVSLHGAGLNPGFLGDVLPLALSSMVRRIARVHVLEISNFAYYPSPEIMLGMMRMGLTPEAFEASSGRLKHWLGGLFRESVLMVADGLRAEIDEITETFELALAQTDLHPAAGLVPAGTVAGQRWKWAAMKDGAERIVHETVWRMDAGVAPHWPQGANRVLMDGEPRINIELPETWLDDPLGATAYHAVNAIPAVCRAPPGIRTYLDLPMIMGQRALR